MKTKIIFNFFQNECLKVNKEDFEVELLKNEQKITFELDGFNNQISYNHKLLYFIRENDEYKFNINFNKKKAFLNLKKYDSINIKVLDCGFKKQKQELSMFYILETDENIINKISIKLKEEIL